MPGDLATGADTYMRLPLFVLIQAAAWAIPAIPVTVRGGPEASSFFVARAKHFASELLAGAGVPIRWVNRHEPGAIVITLEHSAAFDGDPGPLGAARLYEGTRIRISLPRLRAIRRDRGAAELLAYVMVHEIAHILQAVDIHAPEGIMKAKWGPAEFRDIAVRRLRFSTTDIARMQDGLARRKNIRAGITNPVTDSALLKRRTLP